MKNVRLILLVCSGLLVGCNFFPAEFSQWFSSGLTGGNQTVGDVTPDNIEDPNTPAKGSPAATQDPIRLRLSNPSSQVADCRVTMELVGQEVHLSVRRLLAASSALVIGPDRADIITIDATFQGTTPVVMDTIVLRIGVDFQSGQLINVELTPPEEEEPAQTERPTILIDKLDDDVTATVGDTVEFDIITTNATSAARIAISADPDEDAANANEIAIESELPAADLSQILWNTSGVAPGTYLIRAVLTQDDTTVTAESPAGRIILQAAPILGACCYPDAPCEIVTESECLGGVWLGADTTCDECPECVVVCPIDGRVENEACGELVNYGCITAGEPVYEPLACGETVCGTVWMDVYDPNDPNFPIDPNDPNSPKNPDDPSVYPFDFDWYQFTVGHDAYVTITIDAEFYFIAGLMRSDEGGYLDCDYLSDNLLELGFGAMCMPSTFEHCVPAGTYYVLLYPLPYEDMEITCNDANRYTISLDCDVCEYVSGACCLGDTCVQLSAEDCEFVEGEYQGDGAPCDPNPCVPATGACCLGDGVCEVMTQAECWSYEADYRGDYTTCDPNPCLEPVGACCYSEFLCDVMTVSECDSLEGVYQGDGTGCDPNPCYPPYGACCFSDGLCEMYTASECDFYQGSYQGDDTGCDPNPCPQPEGACCFGEECSYLTQEQCDLEGGVYQGDYIPCEPNPCIVYADGDDCDHPIGLVADTDLPYFNTNTTCGRGNYHQLTCLDPYDAGEEIVYRIEVQESMAFWISLDPKGTQLTGMAVFLDGCAGTKCYQAVDEFGKGIPYSIGCQLYEPGTYYLMIDLASDGGGCIPQFDLSINPCD